MEKKVRQYRSNQGRNPKKTEDNYKIFGFVMSTGLVLFIGYVLYTLFV